ncbi:Hypothetical predicted protein [Olea europaea subsp. europaea]|uniref:DUF1985 domain-containing protein n=1 Tax=Olea europaea subsp. europaea TaxID=158383 RepID=A0A8S0US17_OLEEU|nr:Hypothetical predicted protein [Olea europaea subsp. europaea]
MEVRQSTHDEMSFKVGGKHFKFSIEEFALVTGLKCHGDDNTSMYNVGHCRIKHSNFRHRKNVYRKDIENAFNNLTAQDDHREPLYCIVTNNFFFSYAGCIWLKTSTFSQPCPAMLRVYFHKSTLDTGSGHRDRAENFVTGY